ncbi:hypothetical protein IC582_020824 [Cucumis melo]
MAVINKVYKSFVDVIYGKEGRFRETLLGKERGQLFKTFYDCCRASTFMPRKISILLFQTF